MPEITINDEFGIAIFAALQAYGVESVIEIGSWDGTGSTRVIASALAATANPRMTCVESDPTRHAALVERTAHVPWITTVCQPSVSRAGMTARSFEQVWQSRHNRLRYPRDLVESWWAEQPDTPPGYLETLGSETWDAALIDGGEFTGWDDYRLLRDRVRVLMLDDVFHAYKCARAHEDLRYRSHWSCVWSSAFVRNGASIWVRTG